MREQANDVIEKDETEEEICVQTNSIKDPLLTHQLNRGGYQMMASFSEVRADIRCFTAVWSQSIFSTNMSN